MFISCQNNTKQPTINQYSNKMVINETPENKIIDIPYGYTTGDITPFHPRNGEERNFMNEMEKYIVASMNQDYKTVLSMIYPDYWKDIQKRIPNKSIKEIKKKVKEIYPRFATEKYQKKLLKWDKAERARFYITDIKNRVQEGNNVLYLYECYNLLYSDNDSIKEFEPTYCLAASVDRGKHWHDIPSQGFWSLLSYRFSKQAIDKVQRIN